MMDDEQCQIFSGKMLESIYEEVEYVIDLVCGAEGRDVAIAKERLQESLFWAKRSALLRGRR